MPLIRTPFVVAACFGFLAGVGVLSIAFGYTVVPSWWFVMGIGVACMGTIARIRAAWRSVLLVGVGAAVFGAVRFLVALPVTPMIEQTPLTVEGRVVRVVQFDRERARVLLDVVGYEKPIAVSMEGDAVQYGDVVRVRCRLRSPDRPRDMLTLAGVCTAQSVRLLAQGAGSPLLRLLAASRTHLLAVNDAFLVGAPRALVAAAVLGDRSAVHGDIADAFRRTGTVHALVISGAHMTIIGMLLSALFQLLPFRRRTVMSITMGTIALFVAMVGAEPSAVRGAIMVIALLAVERSGRMASRTRILLLTACAMVLIHPHILAFDLGFQLSFAAVAGIILLTPLLSRLLPVTHAWAVELRDTLAASTAATVATAPLIMGAFGTFSLLGIFVNIPVLLLLESFLLAAIVLLVGVSVVPIIAPIVAWPPTVLGAATVWLVDRAARIPFAQVEGTTLHWWFVCALYGLLAAFVLRAHWRQGTRILSPFASPSGDVALLLTGGPSPRAPVAPRS